MYASPSRIAGRRALAGLFTAAMVVGGGSALSMSAANAQENPLGQITGSIGATQFAQECVALDAGLYQTAYSETENAVFVTRSVGRPPVTESTLTKVDADSLEVVDSVDPAVNDEESGARTAVYGVAVDDANGLVWTTNTRDNTVAVYDAKTLDLVKQFDAGLVDHARDVAVDPETGKAYVSAPTTDSGVIYEFDGTDLDAEPTVIELPELANTVSLDLDPATGALYTVDLGGPHAAKVDTRNANEVTTYNLGDSVEAASGVTIDTENGNIWAIDQTTGSAVVVNEESGEVVENFETGEGALNAKYDDASGLVYVSNRTANNITVYDAATFEQVGDLPAGPNAALGQTPNHVSVDGKGNAFSVNKFAPEEGEGAGKNQLCRITPDGGPLGSVTGSLDQLTGSLEGIGDQAPAEDDPAEDAPAE